MRLEELGELVLQRRGSMGVRAAAHEIGISPSTLSRVERGHVPDVATIDKICSWLGEDSTKFTGVGDLQIAFKKKTAVSPKTAKAMASMIELAWQKFSAEVDGQGH